MAALAIGGALLGSHIAAAATWPAAGVATAPTSPAAPAAAKPASGTSPPNPADPIWGTQGAASAIIRSLQHLTQSAFPAVDFPVTRYGAKQCRVIEQNNPYTGPVPSPTSAGADHTTAPGSFDSRPAFTGAIKACSSAGGGRVLVPAGAWYCAGPIVLLDNVNFHLAAGCTIYFSPNPRDYAKDGPVDCGANGKLYFGRWQGNDCVNFGSPIYARNARKIALTGEGPTSILNGQGMTPFAGSGNASTCWWTYKRASRASTAVSMPPLLQPYIPTPTTVICTKSFRI